MSLQQIVELSKVTIEQAEEAAKQLIVPWNPTYFPASRMLAQYGEPLLDEHIEEVCGNRHFSFAKDSSLMHIKTPGGTPERQAVPLAQPDEDLVRISINYFSGDDFFISVSLGPGKPFGLYIGIRGKTPVSENRPILYYLAPAPQEGKKQIMICPPLGLSQD